MKSLNQKTIYSVLGLVFLGSVLKFLHSDIDPSDANIQEQNAQIVAENDSLSIDRIQDTSNSVQSTQQNVSEAKHYPDLIGSLSIDEVFEKIENAENQEMLNEAIISLEKILKVEDQIVETIIFLANNSNIESNTFHALMLALASAGTEACQTAFSDLLDDAKGDRLSAIIPYLTQLKEPKVFLIDKIKSLHESAKDQRVMVRSILAFGTMSGRLDSAMQKESFTFLMDKINGSEREFEKLIYVDAIGNLAFEKSIPKLKDLLKSESVNMRSAVVEAFRKFNSSETSELLVKHMTMETDIEVKISASKTLARLPILNNQVTVIEQAFLSSDEVSVQKNLLYACYKNIHTTSECLSFIKRHIDNTKINGTVRKFAAQLSAS